MNEIIKNLRYDWVDDECIGNPRFACPKCTMVVTTDFQGVYDPLFCDSCGSEFMFKQRSWFEWVKKNG